MDNYTQLANKILNESMDSSRLSSDTALRDEMLSLDDELFSAVDAGEESLKSYIENNESPSDRLQAILQKYPSEIKDIKLTGEFADELYDELYEFYYDSGEMPYGVAKARTEDPRDWLENKLYELGAFNGAEHVEDNQNAITADDLKTLETVKALAGGKADGGLFSNPEKQIQQAYGKMLTKISKQMKDVAKKM